MYLITNPIGIDKVIQAAQTKLIAGLHTTKTVEVYGRAFRNERDGGVVPEVFVSGREYQDVMYNDKVDCTIFFDPADQVTYNGAGQAQSEIGIVVQCNLHTLYPDKGRHATELIERDVIDIIEAQTPFRVTGIVKGYPAIEMFAMTSRVRFDMQPHYVFRLQTVVNYQYDNC
jgi:hypothetical protein